MNGKSLNLKPTNSNCFRRMFISEDQSKKAFDIIMTGNATPAQIGGGGHEGEGETTEEITGAARAMREKVIKINAPSDALDTVGTGGDASGTFNISTASSFVVSAAGVPIAKHGNKLFPRKQEQRMF